MDVEITEPLSLGGLEQLFSATADPNSTSLDSSADQGWTLAQAARAFDVTERTIRRWIKEQRLPAWKVAGPRGPEWRIRTGSRLEISDDQTRSTVVQSTDNPTILVLANLVKEQASKLEAASYRNGFLENQMLTYEQQLKLLPDFQAQAARAQVQDEKVKQLEVELGQIKATWWYRFCAWFLGRNVR